jgi:Transposase IS66 family
MQARCLKTVDRYKGGDAPIAEETLRRIAALFGIERTIRGQAPEQRRAVRLTQTTPLIDDLRVWLETMLAKVSGGSRIARAIRYALKHWAGLTVFLDDGRVEIDSNVVERTIRPIALNRAVRRLRSGRRPLGRDCLADRDRQAQRGRSPGLSRRRPDPAYLSS